MSLLAELEGLNAMVPEYGEDEDVREVTKAAVVAGGSGHFQAVGRSRLRDALPPTAAPDPKYHGRVASRKDLFQDEPDDDEDDQDLAGKGGEDQASDGDSDESDEDEEEEDEESVEGEEAMNGEAEVPANLAAILGGGPSEEQVDSERKKAEAVRAQLKLWDGLMTARIKAQKLLSSANRLPLDEELWAAVDPKLRKRCGKEVSATLGALLELQRSLFAQLPALAPIVGAKAKGGAESDDDEVLSSPDASDAEEDKDEEEEEEEEEQEGGSDEEEAEETSEPAAKRRRPESLDSQASLLASRHKAYGTYRDATLKKWDERTRLGPGRKGKKGLGGLEVGAVAAVEQIMADEGRLLQRTQLRRKGGPRIGEEEREAGEDAEARLDPEVFDDEDFYQQLLREVIERKSGGTTDPAALTRRYLELQRLRGKTSKRTGVDVRASKGRKVRYSVMRKLLSFMGPVEPESIPRAWDDHRRDQLFSSLFTPTP